MSNEISFQFALSAYKPTVMSAAVSRALSGLLFNMAANYFVGPTVILVATGGTAIPLGQVTTPAWACFINKDVTNFIRMANGSGGAKLVKMLPGEPAVFRVDDTSIPFAFADTAAALLEYMIFSL